MPFYENGVSLFFNYDHIGKRYLPYYNKTENIGQWIRFIKEVKRV